MSLHSPYNEETKSTQQKQFQLLTTVAITIKH